MLTFDPAKFAAEVDSAANLQHGYSKSLFGQMTGHFNDRPPASTREGLKQLAVKAKDVIQNAINEGCKRKDYITIHFQALVLKFMQPSMLQRLYWRCCCHREDIEDSTKINYPERWGHEIKDNLYENIPFAFANALNLSLEGQSHHVSYGITYKKIARTDLCGRISSLFRFLCCQKTVQENHAFITIGHYPKLKNS